MRVLVCGGRNFTNTELIYNTLNNLLLNEIIDCIIEGDARGVDRIAGYWAKKHRIDLKLFPANWKQYGLKAGPIRNQQMIDEGRPNLVLAFPGGSGTADMIKRAKLANIEIRKYK